MQNKVLYQILYVLLIELDSIGRAAGLCALLVKPNMDLLTSSLSTAQPLNIGKAESSSPQKLLHSSGTQRWKF